MEVVSLSLPVVSADVMPRYVVIIISVSLAVAVAKKDSLRILQA